MSRTIICTTGISIAQGVGLYRAGQDLEDYRQRIRQRLQLLEMELPNEKDFLIRASAESNSLVRMSTSSSDVVYLLHTETEDGRVCAEELAGMIKRCLTDSVILQRIDGLQVFDPQKFRRVGIQNLFSRLHEICAPYLDDPDAEVLLNAAGGYKSVIPYQTLFGLLYRIPVTYIFEQSPAMITLPPAPISFDYERLSQALDALRQLESVGVMAKEAFLAAIPGLAFHDRDWFESLLEEESGQVTLSAFGLLLYTTLAKSQASVLISPQAAAAFAASEGATREQFVFMLSRVGDPLWRQGKRHAFSQTELTVYKPGRTGERMAGIVRGSTVYVCELYGDHDEYERKLPGKRIVDYRLGDFVPWMLPPDEVPPAASEEESFRQLHARLEAQSRLREEWEQACQAVDRELEQVRERCRGMENQLADQAAEAKTLAQQLSEATDQLSRAREDSQSLEQALASSRQQIQRLEQPWWRRLFGKD